MWILGQYGSMSHFNYPAAADSSRQDDKNAAVD